jgi:hypothetical protein
LTPEVRSALSGTFPFAGVDCERLTANLIAGSNRQTAVQSRQA